GRGHTVAGRRRDGWDGPLLPPEVWTLLKTFALSFVAIWLRVAYPRLREDQLQRLAWLWLVPVTLAQMVLTGGRPAHRPDRQLAELPGVDLPLLAALRTVNNDRTN